MFFLNLFRRLIPRLLLGNVVFFATLAPSFADSTLVVEHHDPVESDATLSLSKVVDLTLEKYPDVTWLNSLEEEAAALAQRGNSWTAGASQAGLHFQEATSGTLHYIDAHVQVPLWNLGQRDAEQRTAKLAESSAMSQAAAVKLRVAGLIRVALWDMTLANLSYEQSKAELTLTDQLLAKVQRRVELGDLPRADLLLAQSESLQKRSVVTLAEAELMHTRKRYSSITQITKVPGDYQEKLADILKIQQSHPVLVAINSQIERKQAEVNAIKLVGSGQTNLAIGINSDRFTNDPRSNQTESFNIGVTVPFGGNAHLAPQVAAVNVELNKLIAEREQLSRVLEQAHHEAEHNLEVNRVELGIANELQQVAEDHLKMTQSSFSVGEINLMDLLRIQSRTQQAVLNAKQRAVMLQRDIALYNQAVGVTP
ncbi:TolC family protein [Methylobacter tundripaludum]|uniref:TolC family protein n=1 Tax=Methylobacter tundripaludum TaxID=173365 RepID=UPI0004DEDF8A|nr:TolC family protein [Methylobacter tundripaludum]